MLQGCRPSDANGAGSDSGFRISQVATGQCCRLLAASAALIITGAVAAVAPAHADEIPDGTYTYTEPDVPSAQWTVMPVCTPIVGDLREPLLLPAGCVLRIAVSQSVEASAKSIASGVVTVPSGSARRVGGQWSYTTPSGEGKVCPDGTRETATDTVSFDGGTLSGVRTTTWTAVCGLAPGLTKRSFTLVRVGPTPFPIERQPLSCDPGGLRQCS